MIERYSGSEAGQPVAPVMRLVVNNEHRKSPRELAAEYQTVMNQIGQIADHLLEVVEILAHIGIEPGP